MLQERRREIELGERETPVTLSGNRVEISRGLDGSAFGEAYKKNWSGYTPLASYMTEDEADYYASLYENQNEATADFWFDSISSALEKRAASNTPKEQWISHNPLAESSDGYQKYLSKGLKEVDREEFNETDHTLPSYMNDDEWTWYAYTYGKFGKEDADA